MSIYFVTLYAQEEAGETSFFDEDVTQDFAEIIEEAKGPVNCDGNVSAFLEEKCSPSTRNCADCSKCFLPMDAMVGSGESAIQEQVIYIVTLNPEGQIIALKEVQIINKLQNRTFVTKDNEILLNDSLRLSKEDFLDRIRASINIIKLGLCLEKMGQQSS